MLLGMWSSSVGLQATECNVTAWYKKGKYSSRLLLLHDIFQNLNTGSIY